jgi:hypothetical protein
MKMTNWKINSPQMTSLIMKKMTKGKDEQKIDNIMSQWGSVLQIQIGLKGLQIVMPIPTL